MQIRICIAEKDIFKNIGEGMTFSDTVKDISAEIEAEIKDMFLSDTKVFVEIGKSSGMLITGRRVTSEDYIDTEEIVYNVLGKKYIR